MNFPFSFDYCYIHVSSIPRISGDKPKIIYYKKKWCFRGDREETVNNGDDFFLYYFERVA
jgi:hypothetical protein